MHEETYFAEEYSDSKIKYSDDDILKMLDFLVDNIFRGGGVAGEVFQQTVDIPMGTKCVSYTGRHLSVFIRSGIHTVFALNGKETVSISVQSHLQVHR